MMGITEKIANAKATNWLTEGLSETEIKTTVELAKISAKIEKYRIDSGMTQKEFAAFMGVSQGMVSKWESREYNFTVKSLIEICEKTGFSLSVSLDRYYTKSDYAVLSWDKENVKKHNNSKNWVDKWTNKEAIA